MITLQQYNDAKELIENYFKQQYPSDQCNEILKIEKDRTVKQFYNSFKDSIYLSILKHEFSKRFDFIVLKIQTRSKEQGYNYEDNFTDNKFEVLIDAMFHFKSDNFASYSIDQFFFRSINPNIISKWDKSKDRFTEKQFDSYELFLKYLTDDYFPDLIEQIYQMWKNNSENLPIPNKWFKENNFNVTKVDIRKIEKDLSKIVKKIVEEHFHVENFKKHSLEKNSVEYSFDIDEKGEATWKNSYVRINDAGIIGISLCERYEGGDYEDEISLEIDKEIKTYFK